MGAPIPDPDPECLLKEVSSTNTITGILEANLIKPTGIYQASSGPNGTIVAEPGAVCIEGKTMWICTGEKSWKRVESHPGA